MTYPEQLYYLIREYIKGNYDTNTFCEQFSLIYDMEVDDDDLNEIERTLFSNLSRIAYRFSPYEEDLAIPNMYYTEQEVKVEACRVQQELNIV